MSRETAQENIFRTAENVRLAVTGLPLRPAVEQIEHVTAGNVARQPATPARQHVHFKKPLCLARSVADCLAGNAWRQTGGLQRQWCRGRLTRFELLTARIAALGYGAQRLGAKIAPSLEINTGKTPMVCLRVRRPIR